MHRFRSLRFLIAIKAAALLLAGCMSPAADQTPTRTTAQPVRLSAASSPCPLPADAEQRRREILSLVNAIRKQHGLTPVRPENRLQRAAQAHACDNAGRASYAHTGSDGSDLRDRLMRQGFRPRIAIENTGLGFGQDSDRMVDFWMNSTYHRANLLNPKVRRMGLGIARPQGGRTAWVLNMGTPLN